MANYAFILVALVSSALGFWSMKMPEPQLTEAPTAEEVEIEAPSVAMVEHKAAKAPRKFVPPIEECPGLAAATAKVERTHQPADWAAWAKLEKACN